MIKLNTNPSKRDLRQFAMLWLPIFLCLLAYLGPWKSNATVTQGMLIAAAVSLVLGAVFPVAIKPIFVGAMIVTFPIGYVVSHVLLALTFFLVVTPMALVLKLLGKDPMTRRWNREATTYWEPVPQARNENDYFKQY